jgi:hypothetical protein
MPPPGASGRETAPQDAIQASFWISQTNGSGDSHCTIGAVALTTRTCGVANLRSFADRYRMGPGADRCRWRCERQMLRVAGKRSFHVCPRHPGLRFLGFEHADQQPPSKSLIPGIVTPLPIPAEASRRSGGAGCPIGSYGMTGARSARGRQGFPPG